MANRSRIRPGSFASCGSIPAPARQQLRPRCTAVPRGKEQQDQFCTVVKNYIQARNKVAAEANPIRRAEMHPPDPWSFEDSIARVFGPNGEFVDWTGRLFFSVAGSDVVLTFQPTCGSASSISFTNGYPADQRASARAARISLSSPFADKLREASPGSVFRVSGRLFARTGAGKQSLAECRQSDGCAATFRRRSSKCRGQCHQPAIFGAIHRSSCCRASKTPARSTPALARSGPPPNQPSRSRRARLQPASWHR
jgi:hypothetical protein